MRLAKYLLKDTIHEIATQIGNFNHYQGQFDFSGPFNLTKTLRYRLIGVIRKSNNQYKYVPNNTFYLAPSFTWEPNKSTQLTILSTFNKDEFGPPQPFLPLYGTILANPNGKISPYTFLENKHLDNHLNQFGLGYILHHRFNHTWSIYSTSRYNYTNLFTQTLSGTGLAKDMRTLNRTAYQYKITGKVFSSDNYIKAQWQTKNIHSSSIIGFSWRNTGEDYYLLANKAPSIDIFNPIYNSFFNPYTSFAKTFQKTNEIGIYVGHNLIFLKHIALDMAIRQD